MTDKRSKIMDNLIAQDADLIDIEVTDEDREVFIRLSGPDDEGANRIRRGLTYTWEVGLIARHRQKAAAYWYRQGKDDGWQMCKENEIDRLREELAEAYVKLSGKSIHTSDCATSNAPAMEPGPCNCDAPGDTDLVAKLRDTDSYYRLQEKHWCIDGEELERQRLAAADRIEALQNEIENMTEQGDGDVGLIHWQGERIETLEAALREVFEQWAGSEGFIPETAPEGYLLQLTKRMADIARAALGETK